MKKNLCIVLTTDYESMAIKDKNVNIWIKETKIDLETIKNTLGATHEIMELKINSKNKKFVNLKNDIDNFISKNPNFSNCHIVLNSHGSRSALDLPQTAILGIAENISIPIAQISALVCSAMSGKTSEDIRQTKIDEMKTGSVFRADERGQQHKPQPSSMEKLKTNLEKLNTKILHSFNIYGPKEGYDPEDDRAVVEHILAPYTNILKEKNDKIAYLKVKIEPHEKFNIQDLKNAIEKIKYYPGQHQSLNSSIREKLRTKKFEATSIEDYNAATNLLGEILKDLYTKTEQCFLNKTEPQAEENILINILKQNECQIENSQELYRAYNKWMKANKVYSSERIKVYEKLIELQETTQKLLKGQLSSQGLFKGAEDEVSENTPPKLPSTFNSV